MSAMQERFTFSFDPLKGKSEQILRVKNLVTGKSYNFRIKNKRIQVEPAEKWSKELPEAIQDQAFNLILDKFRARSKAKHIKTAAIGITENNEIFIATNTENRGEDDTARDCAEQNMINDFHQSARIKHPQKIKTIYVKGGADSGNPSIICPCGSCTDMLSKEMSGDSARVVVFPVASSQSVDLKTDAKKIFDIKDGQGWDTTIGHLANLRELPLNDEGKRYAQAGFKALVKHMPHVPDNLDGNPNNNDKDNISSHPIIPVNAAISENHPTQFVIFAQQQIYSAIANRLDKNFETLLPAAREDYIKTHIGRIEVAVVRFADGVCKEAVRVKSTTEKSTLDKASNSAVIMAAQSHQVANQPITDVWYMEFNPQKMEQGVMRSPNKHCIERTIKRGSPDKEIQFHIVPFMQLSLNDESLKKHSKDYSASDLLVGYFKGAEQMQPNPSVIAGVLPQGRLTAAKEMDRA